jgi:XTP/dITP diphosphohydrolase
LSAARITTLKSPVRFVLATRNAHKVKELSALIAPYELELLPDDVELPPETGSSFAENALIKAGAAARATGRVALADDSGIVVAALGGEPGIRSARYAGEDATDEQNLQKLLAELRGQADRRAAYVCALVLADPAGGHELFEARCEGTVIDDPRGSGGFGYDPAFVPDERPPGDERTMAELAPAEKDEISHRGRAARALLDWLSARS